MREVVDLYGRTERFDVIAITDHILMARDILARTGRFISFGSRQFSVTEDRFPAYLDEVHREAERARKLYGLLVIPGAEITQNHIRSRNNSHIVGLNLREYVSADQPAEAILKAIRRMSPAATFTSPNTCTRGRRWCAERRTGKPSRGHCGKTSISR